MKVFHQRKGTTKGTCGIRAIAKIWNYSSFLYSVDNCILEAHSCSTSFKLMSLTIKKQANSLSNFFLEKEFIFLNWWDLLIKKNKFFEQFSGERVAYIFTSNAFLGHSQCCLTLISIYSKPENSPHNYFYIRLLFSGTGVYLHIYFP